MLLLADDKFNSSARDQTASVTCSDQQLSNY
jgi:hypothetical protein